MPIERISLDIRLIIESERSDDRIVDKKAKGNLFLPGHVRVNKQVVVVERTFSVYRCRA